MEIRETELGVLPADWEITTLGKLLVDQVLLARNGFPCGNHNDKGIGIPHLRPFNIDNDGRIRLDTIKYIQTNVDVSKYFLQQGDVIFNNTNSEELVGKTGFWQAQGKFVLSNHMTILRILQDGILDGIYLSKFLQKRWEDGYFTAICRRHVNQASISLARLEQIAIALPPLPEQRAIARVLSTIQRAMEAQDNLIAAARELKKSLLRQLFTQGLDANGAVQETEIGVMPEHWELVKLGDVASLKSGGTPDRSKPKYWNGNIPWVKTGEIKYARITNTEERITELGLENSAARWIPAGTLLMAMYGQGVTRGRVAILGIDATINQACAAIFTSEKIVAEYLFYFLTFIYESIRDLGHGANQRNLNSSIVKSIEIALPPLSEQREIARILSTVDKKIETEEKRQAALQALFKTMLQQLMTGQIRISER